MQAACFSTGIPRGLQIARESPNVFREKPMYSNRWLLSGLLAAFLAFLPTGCAPDSSALLDDEGGEDTEQDLRTVFLAQEDTFVSESEPTRLFGDSTRLSAVASPLRKRVLLRFAVNGVPTGASLRLAKVRLYVTNPTDDTGALYRVSGAWSQANTSWSNAPGVGGRVATVSTAAFSRTWVEADVGGIVSGNGTFDFYLFNESADSVSYTSSEAGKGPRLVLLWEPAVTQAPSPDASLAPPDAGDPGNTVGDAGVPSAADAGMADSGAPDAGLPLPPFDAGASGTVREVGQGRAYASIGSAVAASGAGDTVLVHAGTYFEEVHLTLGIHILGAGDGPAIVDGQCQRTSGIRITGASGAVLHGLTLQNTVGAALFLESGADHTTVDGNTLQDYDCTWNGQDVSSWGQDRAGVAAWYAGPGQRLTNNLIRFRSAQPTKGPADGIWFKSNDANPSGGGHLISGNRIEGGWDGIGGEEEGSAHGCFDGNTTIENNVVRTCWDDGIQVEGGDRNVRVQGNDVSGCGTGIAFAAPMAGPLYVEENYIHDLETGLWQNLFCYKVGNSSTATVFLSRNRCIVDSPAEQAEGGANGLSQTNGGLFAIVSRGNTFRVSRYVLESTESPRPAGESFDQDCMTTTDASRFIKWGGDRYGSLAAFAQATGHELNGSQSACP